MTRNQNVTGIERLGSSTDAAALDYSPEGEPLHLVRDLKRLLHGRLRLAAVLGFVFASIGVVAGWKLPKPLYVGVGILDITPKGKPILNPGPEQHMIPMFDSFCASLVRVMQSERVTQLAMNSESWLALDDPGNARVFNKSLSIHRSRGQRHIEILFHHTDPGACEAGVNGIIDGFMKVNEERGMQSGLATRKLLEGERNKLTNRLASLDDDIFAITDEKGPQALDSNYNYQVAQINSIRTLLRDVELEIVNLETASGNGNGDGDERPELTAEQIAVNDPTMEGLLLDRAKQQEHIVILRDSQNLGAKHPTMVQAVAELKAIDARIAARVRSHNDSASGLGAAADLQLQALERRKVDLEVRLAEAEGRAKDLGKQVHSVQQLQSEKTAVGLRLEDVKFRMAQLSTESDVAGRVTVMSRAQRPGAPSKDRRPAFMVLGVVMGIGLGLGTTLLIGFRDRRVRNLVDADSGRPRGNVLGVLPDLSQSNDFVNDPALVSHCIHNVRTAVQLQAGADARVVAVTSASAGSGKTTMAYALGLSYGATGAETLLVDCDLVGRGLSRSLANLVHRRVARIVSGEFEAPGATAGQAASGEDSIVTQLKDTGRWEREESEPSLDDLFARARTFHGSREASGEEVLDLLQFLASQKGRNGNGRAAKNGAGDDDQASGILEVLAGSPLDDCVVRSGIPNLSVLTVGAATAEDSGKLSPDSVKRLIEACRARYDNVVIDTGPVLGSLEATIVATEADAVVQVISRGEQRPLSLAALTRLTDLGANVAGVVFNRAEESDLDPSTYSQHSRSRSTPA